MKKRINVSFFILFVDFGFLGSLGYRVSVCGWVLLEFTLKKRTNVSFFILFCRFRLSWLFGISGKWVLSEFTLKKRTNVSFFFFIMFYIFFKKNVSNASLFLFCRLPDE